MSLPWPWGRAWCAAIPQSTPSAAPHPWRGQASPGSAGPAWQLHPTDNWDKLGADPRSWRAWQGEDKPCRNLHPAGEEPKMKSLSEQSWALDARSFLRPSHLQPSPRAERGGREGARKMDLFLWTQLCHMPRGSGGPGLGWFLGL